MGVRVLIVDDYAPWRDELRSLLGKNPEWHIVGEACDGQEAVEKATEMQPDIVLLDVGMPRLNGIQAAKTIRQRCPQTRILFVTENDDVDIRDAAMEAGAAGYVLKTDAGRELFEAITAALSPRSIKEAPHV